MQTETRTALIVGITGSIGREVSGALLRRGWQVRALHRDPGAAAATFPIPSNGSRVMPCDRATSLRRRSGRRS